MGVQGACRENRAGRADAFFCENAKIGPFSETVSSPNPSPSANILLEPPRVEKSHADAIGATA